MKNNHKWFEMKATGQKKAEVFIYDYIGKDYWGDGSAVEAKKFINSLKSLGDIDELFIRINSPGGSVYEGNAIYNFLKSYSAKKTVQIDSLAASIASIIAMVGDTVIMPKNAFLMIHNPLSVVFGEAEDLRKQADLLDKIKEGAISVYEEKCKQPREKIAELMDEETWMTADEAKALGFADQVVGAVKMAASASFDLSAFKHAPVLLLGRSQERPPEPEPQQTAQLEPTKGAKTPMDKETLKKEHPDLFAEVMRDGAESERARIKGIEDLALKGQEKLAEECKFDGKTSPEQFALKMVAAQKAMGSAYLDKIKAEAPKPVTQPPVETAETAKTTPAASQEPKTLDDKLKAEWEGDPELQKEMELEAYLHYGRAKAEKRV